MRHTIVCRRVKGEKKTKLQQKIGKGNYFLITYQKSRETPAQFKRVVKQKWKIKLMPVRKGGMAEKAVRNNGSFVVINSIISDLRDRFQTTYTIQYVNLLQFF